MTADLSPDVRRRAFTAVKDALLGKGDVEPAKSSEFYNYVVSVVARPLQARAAELEAEIERVSQLARDREERMRRAFPHGPAEPCTCDGTTRDGSRCVCWPGHVVGCTCDIEWDWDA